MLVYRAPQIKKFTLNGDKNLIEVPLVARPWTSPTETLRETFAERLWCKPSESMKRMLGNIARLRRRELHSRLPAPYCL